MTSDALDDLLRAQLATDSVKDAVAHAVELSGGRAARSMRARSSLRKDCGATMAKTEGAAATESSPRPNASPRSAPAFRREPRRRLSDAKGYRILPDASARRMARSTSWRARRNLIAFVEVKARASLDDAAYAVTPRQQQRIIDAAQGWLSRIPSMPNSNCDFDAMLIAPRSLPRHLLAAFEPAST
jgi:putative endonuclease